LFSVISKQSVEPRAGSKSDQKVGIAEKSVGELPFTVLMAKSISAAASRVQHTHTAAQPDLEDVRKSEEWGPGADCWCPAAAPLPH
jgi:hypothetical protein